MEPSQQSEASSEASDTVPFDQPDELLFLRVIESHIDGDKILYGAVRLPDFSVNRSRFSKPDDVLDLILYPEHRFVAQCRAHSIPPVIPPRIIPSPGQQVPGAWEFWPEHDPRAGNYAHSEIRMKAQGKPYVRKKDINSDVYRKQVRNDLAELFRVIQEGYSLSNEA